MVSKLDKIIFGTLATGTALGIAGCVLSNHYQSKLEELNYASEMATRPLLDAFDYSGKLATLETVGYLGIGMLSLGSILALAKPLSPRNKK